MKNTMIGDVLRRCREGKGITQEKLCSGICSVSTLSRIENGQQYPTRNVLTKLAERMETEEILYDDYVGDYDFEVYDLSTKVMTCLERGDFRRADNYLENLRYIVDSGAESDKKGECIYKFVELLNASMEWSRGKKEGGSVEIYQYGYYIYEEINELLTRCIELDVKSGYDDLDKIEIRMYNLMGCAKFLQKDYKSAIDIWVRLIEVYRNKDDNGFYYPKEMASLYSNISVALTALEMYEEAQLFFEKGFRLCFDGGGLRLVNRLLHNRMYCLREKGDKNKAYMDLAFSKAICGVCKKDILKYEKIRTIPKSPNLIQVF